jgi:DNA-binding SARP family transcriptional activator/tetratricopeptide (TPR) repeat protein
MLRVHALGPLRVEADGAVIEAPAGRRAWSLLAWLALHPGPHARGELAARFWPDVLDSSARASLRTAVWALRRDLGDVADGALVATADHVGLGPAAGVWVDALAFAELSAAGRLEEAVALCDGGELLAGFGDDWALEARAAHRDRLGDALEALARAGDTAGDPAAALGWTRRQTVLDPLGEEAHRRLMERLAAAGQRSAAIGVYERLRERLRRELQVAPSRATRALADGLRADEPGAALAAAAGGPESARLLPLAGRDRELAEVLECWAAARAGAGGVVTVTGEPGVGKTRLALELLECARKDGARTAICAALDLGAAAGERGGAALGLWAELIGELGRDLEPPPPGATWPAGLAPLAPDLGRRLGGDAEPRAAASPDLERARLHEATVELIEWAARARPVVLALEDVHLADAASLELVAYVGRRAARLPVLLVLTRRPLPRRAEVDAVEHALRSRGALQCEVALGPLAPGAEATLARAVAPLGEPGVAQVVNAAEGNALLAVESARALARGEREPPASLRGAVRAALAPLAPEPRLLADFAAAAGRELARDELRRLPVADPARAAGAAVETGVLVAACGRLGFRHALLREAVYADLPEPHRAWVHEHLAEALAGEDGAGPAAEVARHLRLAGRDRDAVGALHRAGRHAWRVGAIDEACAFLAEAVEIAPGDRALLVDLAEVEAWRDRRPEAGETFERAAALLAAAGDPAAEAEAWLRRANSSRGPLCAPREVLTAARRAVAVLDATSADAPRLRTEALAACAWAEAVAGDPDAADDLLARVEAAGAPDDDLLRHAVEHARALGLIRRGRFADSYAPSAESGELAERAGRPDLSYGSWINAACAAACAGDFECALSFVERGARAVRGTGLRALEVQYLAARSYVLARLGRLDEARAAADAEAELAERIAIPELEATARHDRGMVALALGDLDRAQALLRAALAEGAPVSRPVARIARAEALAGLGRLDEAEAELRATALEPVGPSDFPDTLVPRLVRVQGLVAAARGERTLAMRRLEQAAAGWRRRLDRAADGDRYAATLADLGRPPVAGLVEPERELERVLADLRDLEAARA